MTSDHVTTEEELAAIYGEAMGAARIKEIDHISDDYARFILASPFVVLSTAGPEGLDCSPRGDPKGFVRIKDRKTLLIPDRRGNNRVDSLRNIVRDPRIGLLFLIPGIGETLRVNGRAALSRNQALRESFTMQGKVPALVIEVGVETAYTQCQKALMRSRLWDPSAQIKRSELPTMGEIFERIAGPDFNGKAYDAAYPERLRQTIY